MTIKLRFVGGNAFISEMIELREGTCMPFPPSHVECVSLDGKWHIGQHIDGGMLKRPAGYDLPCKELFLDLPATDEQTKGFYDYIEQSIGEPYDWEAILGYVVPGHFHLTNHAICSAKMDLGLRKVNWYPSKLPLCVPAHCLDPRDLLLILSAIIEVPH
jgi:hypothetical protein